MTIGVADSVGNKLTLAKALSRFSLVSHTHAASAIVSGALALARGGTNADLSATGGATSFLRQTSAGAAVSVGGIVSADLAVALASPPAIGGTTAAAITGTTGIFGTAGASGAKLNVNADASGVGVIIRANATTPSDLQQWQTSAGSAYSYLDSNLALHLYDRGLGFGLPENQDLLYLGRQVKFYRRGGTTDEVSMSGYSNGGSEIELLRISATNLTLYSDLSMIAGKALLTTNSAATFTHKLWSSADQVFSLAADFTNNNPSYPTRIFDVYSNKNTPNSRLFDLQVPLKTRFASTDTNTGRTILTIGHNSSGTPVVGFGSSLVWQLQSSTTVNQNAAIDEALWSVATNASRMGQRRIGVNDVGTVWYGIDMVAISGAVQLGFYGVTPVSRAASAATATDLATAITLANSLKTALTNLGLVS